MRITITRVRIVIVNSEYCKLTVFHKGNNVYIYIEIISRAHESSVDHSHWSINK